METWNCITNKFIEIPEKQVKFLEEIEAVCKKYDLSISHEDVQGAFEIEKFDQENIGWLKSAHVKWAEATEVLKPNDSNK
jgi:hypothetical protein